MSFPDSLHFTHLQSPFFCPLITTESFCLPWQNGRSAYHLSFEVFFWKATPCASKNDATSSFALILSKSIFGMSGRYLLFRFFATSIPCIAHYIASLPTVSPRIRSANKLNRCSITSFFTARLTLRSSATSTRRRCARVMPV